MAFSAWGPSRLCSAWSGLRCLAEVMRLRLGLEGCAYARQRHGPVQAGFATEHSAAAQAQQHAHACLHRHSIQAQPAACRARMTRQAGCEHNFKHGRSTVRSGTAARRSAPCMDKPAGPMRGLERKPVRGTALSMTGERPRSCGERHILVACMSHAGMDGTSGYRVMAALLAHLGALAAGACAAPLRGGLLLEAGARGVQALLAEAGLQRRIAGRSSPPQRPRQSCQSRACGTTRTGTIGSWARVCSGRPGCVPRAQEAACSASREPRRAEQGLGGSTGRTIRKGRASCRERARMRVHP